MDVNEQTAKVSKEDESTTEVTEATASQEEKKASTGEKRQRTLEDSFFKKADSSSKRPKTMNSKTLVTGVKAIASSSRTRLNAINFATSKYVASLSPEETELLKLETDHLGHSWLKLLHSEIRQPYFLNLKKFLVTEGITDDNGKNIFPPAKLIYSWSNLPIGKVKVVIIGQDPYHGPGQAHGLSFSVPPDVGVPPSLVNIYKEIKAEYPEFVIPKHGNLQKWADSGVLLLNSVLTVKPKQAASHRDKGWEQFTDTVVDAIDRYGGASLPNGDGTGKGVVFLAWGAWAAKAVSKLSNKKHLILKSAHPSPLSAHRGFLGNGHFKKANEWLKERHGEDGIVEWTKV